jgi:hypothetical protein
MGVFDYHYSINDYERALLDSRVGVNWPLPITVDVENELRAKVTRVQQSLDKGMNLENALWAELRDLLMTGIVMAENRCEELHGEEE